jgi:hypothetical protein
MVPVKAFGVCVGLCAAVVGAALLWGREARGTIARPVAAAHPMGARVDAVDLLDRQGRPVAFALPEDGRAMVLLFWSARCGRAADSVARLRGLLARYRDAGVSFLAIDSNPAESRAEIDDVCLRLEAPCTVRRDAGGRTMARLGIERSASVVVLDGARRLRYRGGIDDDAAAPTAHYARDAVDAVLAGAAVQIPTAPSYGRAFPLPR